MGLETHVDWPNVSGKYKVVQFIADNKPYIRFATGDDMRHPRIVFDFAAEIKAGIKIHTIHPVYLPADDKFRIAGAGWCDLKPEEKLAVFYGVSADYAQAGIIGIDSAHLDSMRQHADGIELRFDPSRQR